MSSDAAPPAHRYSPKTIFIDNEYHAASDGKTLSVTSPHTGQPFDEIANASESDVDRAVMSARRCFNEEWGNLNATVAARSLVLQNISNLLREESTLELFARLESMDCGKPITESRADIQLCSDVFEYYAVNAAAFLADEQLPPQEEGYTSSVVMEPAGVVGLVTPWNFPLMQAVLKIAPALAAGCTAVLKPSPWASLTCSLLGDVVREAGLPSGALNVVTGGPPESNTGQFLVEHGEIDFLSFTGSGPTGSRLLQSSAEKLRRTSLELGGKGALIVFDDADIDVAVDWAMVGIFLCTGQVCSATSRLLIHEDVEAELIGRLRSKAEEIRLGHPLDSSTQMGPLVSKEQHEKVLKAIDVARSEGCSVLVGNDEPAIDEALRGGYWVAPTILADVPLGSSAWTDEIFGPVLSVRTFKTEDEAIAVVNNTTYGLGNAVLSADRQRAARVAARLQSGIVWQNCNQVLHTATPFGGKKSSGFGWELGKPGLLEYVHPKTVVAATPGTSWNYYG